MNTLLSYILTLVVLVQSTGLLYLKPHALPQNSSLRPMASALSEDTNKGLSAGSEILLPKKSDDPYHPENVFNTFLEGKLRWVNIPEEYLWADIAVFVDELTRLLEKDAFTLLTVDYNKRVFTLHSGGKKSLAGLIELISRRNNLCDYKEAISIIRGELSLARYIDPKYLPENILHTFLESNGQPFWVSIPEEYLVPDIRVLVKELARLCGKDVSDLNSNDYGAQVFMRTKVRKKKSLISLPQYVMRRYHITYADAVLKIAKIIGVKTTKWSSNDWKEVKKLLEPAMLPEWQDIESEEMMSAYLYAHGLTKKQQFLLTGLIKEGKGNKAAVTALIYSHTKQIERFAQIVSNKYHLDQAGLTTYIVRRLETAALSFDPEKGMYSTFIKTVMQSARYDYSALKSGRRRKAGSNVGRYPQLDDGNRYEDNIRDFKSTVLFAPENESIIDRILKSLWILERDRKIFFTINQEGISQREMARRTKLSKGRISQVMGRINMSFAPYEEMTRKVLSGDIPLKTLLDKIRQDDKDSEPTAKNDSTTQKSSSAGIYWPEKPRGKALKNPYIDEYAVSKSFNSLDSSYKNDISVEIEKRIKEFPGKRVRILLVGVGRGFEAFGLMQKYGEKTDITATNKEDLLYRDPELLKKRFAGIINDELIETNNKVAVTIDEAQEYIRTLRKQYIRCNLNSGIPINNKYDIVIFGSGVVTYLRKKPFALQEGMRVCKNFGIVYFDLSSAFIQTEKGEIPAAYCLERLNDPNIIRMIGTGLKFINSPELKIPVFEELKITKKYAADNIITTPFHKVVYKLAEDESNFPLDTQKSSSSGLLEPEDAEDLFRTIAEEVRDFFETHEQHFYGMGIKPEGFDCLEYCCEFKRRFDRYNLEVLCDIYFKEELEVRKGHVWINMEWGGYRYVVDVLPRDGDPPRVLEWGVDIENEYIGSTRSWTKEKMSQWTSLVAEVEKLKDGGRNKSSSSGQRTEEGPALKSKLKDLETGMVDLLHGIFLELSEGEITIERLQKLFEEKESRIFELMQEIKTIRIKLAQLNPSIQGEYFKYLLLTRVDTPDCGMCFYVVDYIEKAAKKAGFKLGRARGDFYVVRIIAGGDPKHGFIAIRCSSGDVALELCSGQIIEANRNRIIIQPIADYKRIITRIQMECHAKALAVVDSLKEALAENGFNDVTVLMQGESGPALLSAETIKKRKALATIDTAA